MLSSLPQERLAEINHPGVLWPKRIGWSLVRVPALPANSFKTRRIECLQAQHNVATRMLVTVAGVEGSEALVRGGP